MPAKIKVFAMLIVVITLGVSLYYVNTIYSFEVYPRSEIHDSEEWFFLSIGLYQNTTHPCRIHSVSCQAEYRTTELAYTIVTDDGVYVVNGTRTTNSNGFLDLYLPVNSNYTVSFIIGEMTGSGRVSTLTGSPTCITDIRMSY